MDTCVVSDLVVVDADIELSQVRQDSSHPRTDLTQGDCDVSWNSLGLFLLVIGASRQVAKGPRWGCHTDTFTSIVCFFVSVNAGKDTWIVSFIRGPGSGTNLDRQSQPIMPRLG